MPYDLPPARVGTDVGQTIGERIHGQWLDLDRLLVQLWESRSIYPNVIHTEMRMERQGVTDYAEYLLPELTMSGINNLIERCGL